MAAQDQVSLFHELEASKTAQRQNFNETLTAQLESSQERVAQLGGMFPPQASYNDNLINWCKQKILVENYVPA